MQSAGVFENRNPLTHIAAAMAIRRILRDIALQTGWDQTKLGHELGVSQATISRWMRKTHPQIPEMQQHDRIMRLARKLDVKSYAPGDGLLVPVMGYVSGGLVVIQSKPVGEAIMPPGGDEETAAVYVRGDSMAADGSVLYYGKRLNPPTDELFGKLCLVGLPGGQILLRTLLKGSSEGLFHLTSRASDPLFDQSVEWAARVLFLGFN